MSSLAHSARGTAGNARHNTLLEVLTRAGFIGYGVLHLAVAWLAGQIALGHRTDEGDQSGALRVLMRQPLGRPLLLIIMVGLCAMALWQLLTAASGYRDEHGWRRRFERLGALARTVVYAALAWTAWKVQSGAPASSAGQQRAATAGVLAHPAGRVLVAIAGLTVVAVGIGLIAYGATGGFAKRLHTDQMGPATRTTATWLGRIGYLAKGAGYGIVGVLLFIAAVRRNAAKSNGLDGALRTLAGQPFGRVLLIVVAVGFAAFGAYCFVQSRYRRM